MSKDRRGSENDHQYLLRMPRWLYEKAATRALRERKRVNEVINQILIRELGAGNQDGDGPNSTQR